MADIDGHRQWVQQRMADQLQRKISQVCMSVSSGCTFVFNTTLKLTRIATCNTTFTCQAKSQNVDDFMSNMRASLGQADGPATSRRLGLQRRQQSPSSKSRRGNDPNLSLQLGVVGRNNVISRAANQSRQRSNNNGSHLPSIQKPGSQQIKVLRSKVSRKAAASAQRAQQLIRDRNPRAAFAVAQASLAPHYERSPSVLAHYKGQRV